MRRRGTSAPRRIPADDYGRNTGVVEKPFGVRFGQEQLKTRSRLRPWEKPGVHLLAGATRRLAVKEKQRAAALVNGPAVKPAAVISRRQEQSATPLTGDEVKRTVYVGSVPVDWTAVQLYKALGIGKTDVQRLRFCNLPIDERYKKLGGVAVRKGLFSKAKPVKDAFLTLKAVERVADVLACNGKRVSGGSSSSSTSAGGPSAAAAFRLVVTPQSVEKQFSRWGTKAVLFVGNLHTAVVEGHLWDHCEEQMGVGTVKNVRVMHDKKTNVSKCCGFVRFRDKRTARSALEKLQGSNLMGRPLHLTPALPEEQAKEADAVRARKFAKHVTKRKAYKDARLKRQQGGATPAKKKEKHAERRALALANKSADSE